jgi:hypothetical protein
LTSREKFRVQFNFTLGAVRIFLPSPGTAFLLFPTNDAAIGFTYVYIDTE